MAIARERVMTVAEYLAWEERQELRHEFIDGEIIEMPGGTLTHALLGANVVSALTQSMGRSGCFALNSEMRVKIRDSAYVYPEVCVFCAKPQVEDNNTSLLNPILVVEVTSPSSRVRDRVDKLDLYQEVASIEAYLIVEQDRHRADLFIRAEQGWNLRIFSQPEDVIPLPMLGCVLPLADVYRGVELAQSARE